MYKTISKKRFTAVILAALIGACVFGFDIATAGESKVVLSGAEETPPVATQARGNATITVSLDKSVNGTVSTTGLAGTTAHIHFGAFGRAGPVIITLIKTVGEDWAVPPGVALTDEQYAGYLKGDLYINVHTSANMGGEIRGQMRPLNGG